MDSYSLKFVTRIFFRVSLCQEKKENKIEQKCDYFLNLVPLDRNKNKNKVPNESVKSFPDKGQLVVARMLPKEKAKKPST